MTDPARPARLDASYVRRARPPGSARDLAVLFAHAGQKRGLTALLALQTEVLSAAYASTDHAVAHARIEWWREELDRLLLGSPAHPVTRVLHEAAFGVAVDFAPLRELLLAAQWQLARLALETREEFESFGWRSQGVIHWIGMQLTGADKQASAAFARELGVALCLERALLDLASAARTGSILLPIEELNEQHIAIEDLAAPTGSPVLCEYVAALCATSRDRLQSARDTLPAALSFDVRAQLVLAALCNAQLARIQASARDGGDWTAELSTLRRVWLGWRTARQAARSGGPSRRESG